MNRSRALLVLAVVFATAFAQLSGADRAYAPPSLTFTDIGASAPLTAVSTSSVAWGDYDLDGDLDILVTGDTGTELVSQIYENNGDGTFTEDEDAAEHLAGVRWGSVAWGDYDSDGDLDILLTGDTGAPGVPDPISEVYENEVTADGRTFTATGAALADVHYGSSAWGDYDSDGDLDILLTGDTGSGFVSGIYENINGTSFSRDTVADSNLSDVCNSSVAWGDYNSDGKLDILLTGRMSSSPFRVSEIYKNNGAGSPYTEDEDADENLTAVYNGSVAWGDYDNDDDLDILLTGSDISTDPVAAIYENNGAGNAFSEDTTADTGLTDVYSSSVAWGDYTSDGKLDVLLTGFDGATRVSDIFRNNGVGNAFVNDGTDGLPGVNQGSTAWGDYDNDDDLDILLTGYDAAGAGTYISRVYQNNATTANTAPSAPTNLSASVGSGTATLSWNAATDTEQSGTPNGLSYNVRVGTTPGGSDVVAPMALANGKRLVAQTGNAGEQTSYTLKGLTPGVTYYWSVQAIDNGFAGSSFSSEGLFPSFVDIGAPLSGVYSSSVAWGDYDSDGDLDLILTGDTYSSCVGEIYENTGSDIFARDDANSDVVADVCLGSAAWGDYDSDGDLDILLTGHSVSGRVAKVYRNDAGSFYEDSPASAGLVGVEYSSAAWGDYDQDGDLDILLAGREAASGWDFVTKVYRNDGGDFVFDPAGSDLTGIGAGSLAWGDYDSDGDLDLVIAGLTSSSASSAIIEVYENDAGSFSVDSDASDDLTPASGDTVAWGDYDADGEPDLLLTGWDESGHARISRIYRNSDGTFTDIGAGLTGFDASSAAWGDYDSDGYLDVVLAGDSGSGYLSKIFRNDDGSGIFTDTGVDLTGAYDGSVAWGDYDRDGDLDLVLAGWNDPGLGGFAESKIYRNNIDVANTPPGVPNDLSASSSGDEMTLSWSPPAVADETPAAGLTYNVFVRRDPDHDCTGPYVVSPVVSNGSRSVPAMGNAGQNSSYTLKDLPGGSYCWSVQAIDNSFAGSPFASEQTLVVPESFSLSSSAYTVAENGGSITITINRTGSTLGSASVHFATANGTTTAGSDYTDVSQTLTFANGETSKTVSIAIADDSLIESSETVLLSLSSPSSGATLGSPSSATLTIADNDRAFAFSSATYSVGEAGGSAAVTINRTGLTSGSDSVSFSSTNGTATAGSDYTAVNQTVSFAAGESTKTVSILIRDDSSVESSETVLLSLSSPSAGATLASPSAATLTISDNDVAPPPPDAKPATTTSKGKITSCKLSKTSFSVSQAGKVKLTCKLSPRSKIFRWALSLKQGKKWALVKSVKKTGSFKTYTITVKKLFAGKKIKRGQYRLKLSADRNSKTLGFSVK